MGDLSEEIRQKKFINQRSKFLINLLYTANWISDITTIALKPHGINDQHYNILRILKGANGNCMSPGEIKAVLLNKRGDLTRLLDKLVSLNWVGRDVNDENRRKMNLLITSKGLEMLEVIDTDLQNSSHYFNNLSEAQAEEGSNILDQLRG